MIIFKCFLVGSVDKRCDIEFCSGVVEDADERQGGLVVAGRDAAHLLEVLEHALDAVAILLTPTVCFLWSTTAFA